MNLHLKKAVNTTIFIENDIISGFSSHILWWSYNYKHMLMYWYCTHKHWSFQLLACDLTQVAYPFDSEGQIWYHTYLMANLCLPATFLPSSTYNHPLCPNLAEQSYSEEGILLALLGQWHCFTGQPTWDSFKCEREIPIQRLQGDGSTVSHITLKVMDMNVE